MDVNALPTIWESWMSPTATFPPLIVCLAFTAAADLIEFRVSDCFSYNNPNDEPANTSWLCQLTLVGCSLLATIFSLLLLISAALWQSGREDYQTNVWQHLVRFTMVNGTQVLAASHALHTERPVRSLAGSPSDLWEKHYLPSAVMTGGILSRDGSTLSTLSNGEWNLFILTPRFYSASVQFRDYPAHCARATFCLSSYSCFCSFGLETIKVEPFCPSKWATMGAMTTWAMSPEWELGSIIIIILLFLGFFVRLKSFLVVKG